MNFRILSVALLAAVSASAAPPLPNGMSITPNGASVGVGNFPVNMVLSPDGRYVVVTDCGNREYLSVLDARTGKLVSQRDVNASLSGSRGKEGLYFGLAFAPPAVGKPATLYVSRGAEDRVAAYTLGDDGTLTDSGPDMVDPGPTDDETACPAGIALSADGATLFAANDEGEPHDGYKGKLAVLDTATGRRRANITVPGYPYAVAVVTRGPAANHKVFVASERDAVVTDIDPDALAVRRNISTGDDPLALLLDKTQRRLFVANAGSDTISVVNTATDMVTSTLLLRPSDARGLPGASPISLALDAANRRLYVALADMNAVAVVDVTMPTPTLIGYMPTGWYPTSVLVAPDARHLFVSCAKGVTSRLPNNVKRGPGGKWGQYDMAILDGVVSMVDLPSNAQLHSLSVRVMANNRLPMVKTAANPVAGIPIKHVIYIIKENRTYDQILGDIAKGNGDTGSLMFGREVTPNQHRIVERFALLDNFYCCAEVSGQGWNWSTSGMTSPYTERTVNSEYSGRGRTYDWEGTNAGQAVDLLGVKDVATAPGGYLWDDAMLHGISFRNYGCFVGNGPRTNESSSPDDERNVALRRSLIKATDANYRQFDLNYADSEAWVRINAPKTVSRKRFGRHNAPSRFTEWKREFDAYVKSGSLPSFEMIRMGRDHTQGTRAGNASPSAEVADNDFGVGQIVDAVSHSPYWKSTAIFVLEDDAQSGYDHVDCHRSTVYIASPFVKPGTVDHRFYNTDSVLHTIETILGIPPMNRYDAAAPVLDFWSKTPVGAEPFNAAMADASILSQVNTREAYRAADSAKLPFQQADAVPDDVLNDILWHAVRGRNTPPPEVHNSPFATAKRDADD